MSILTLYNLSVENETREIIKNLNLSINENEIHIIMGPNGSGKSTFAKALAGHPDYKITKGNAFFSQKNLQLLSTEDRSKQGLFLAFQSPMVINGLTCFDFFHLIFNEHKLYKNQKTLDAIEFFLLIKNLLAEIGIAEDFLYRDFNEGFSGGEKKKNEVLQMLLLEPKLAILDEIDSGLDIEALKKICFLLKKQQVKTSFLIITHYPKIVELLKPNFVHIFYDGKIQKTGNATLAYDIENKGYYFD